MPALGTCRKVDCTVAATGTCLLSTPLGECPNFDPAPASEVADPEAAKAPALGPEEEPFVRRFHSGLELGTEDAQVLMRKEYSHIIGILGSWDAGKTCLLTSMYLMVANGLISDRYKFLGGQSLQGFEERARLTRGWTGSFPDKLADHTSLADPRSPALLHLALRAEADSREELNLLFTDLPGEWTTNLIDRAAFASSFDFLNRAEAILIVVDAKLLCTDERHIVITRTERLIQRLAQNVKLDRSIPIVIVISKADCIDMKDLPEADALVACAVKWGFRGYRLMTAAFSSKPNSIPNGTGLVECLDFIVKHGRRTSPTLDSSDFQRCGPRMYEQFRS